MKALSFLLRGCFLTILVLSSGCSLLPKNAAEPESTQAYKDKLAESKSALFKPLSDDSILLSDEALDLDPFGIKDEEGAYSKVEPQPPLEALLQMAEADQQTLWQRISTGYALLHEQDKSKFAKTVKTYGKYRRYFTDISKNAAPYLHHIVEAVEKRGMPLEIALIPAVESAFRPNARSPYKAEGLWQFIPSTGRIFGLKQNSWYDGRRDVLASTNAALDYLQSLHKRMDGDWLHAIAAYNCGEANVRRAIRKNLKKGKPIDYWSLDLPKETKAYIPKLMALSEIIGKPDDYGIKLEEIPNKPYLRKIDVGEQIDLKLAAELAGLSEKHLRRLNPGFKRHVTAPKGPYHLVLPVEKIDSFQERLKTVSNKLPYRSKAKNKKKTSKKALKRYKIRSGDSLWTIARKHNTSVKRICQLNSIRPKTRLKIGRQLWVPTRVSSSTELRKAKPKKAKPVTVVARNNQRHRIRQGDTLGKIARRYNTSIKALCELNGITPKTALKIGKVLLIPSHSKIARES